MSELSRIHELRIKALEIAMIKYSADTRAGGIKAYTIKELTEQYYKYLSTGQWT